MNRRTTFQEFRDAWPTIVGAQIAHVAEPVALACTGVLYVRVFTPSWRRDLQRLTHNVVARLPESIDGMPVRRIHWLEAAA